MEVPQAGARLEKNERKLLGICWHRTLCTEPKSNTNQNTCRSKSERFVQAPLPPADYTFNRPRYPYPSPLLTLFIYFIVLPKVLINGSLHVTHAR